jgi:hypothetical protein
LVGFGLVPPPESKPQVRFPVSVRDVDVFERRLVMERFLAPTK